MIMIKNKKGFEPMALVMIVGVISAAFIILFSTDLIEKGNSAADSEFSWRTCSETIDGEGSFVSQNIANKCPCDKDDPTNELWVGKYYVVKQEVLEKEATYLFDKNYLSSFDKKNPLRISQLDVDRIGKYISDNYDDGSSRSTGSISYSYKLNTNVARGGEQPDMGNLCIGLDNKDLCQKQLFMIAWFEENSLNNPECGTPLDVCRSRYASKCDISLG